MARQTPPMTQEQLAGLAGMSQSSLSRRLGGEIAFDTDELARVGAALNVPPTRFTGAATEATTGA
jgi:transcriptional regulator with XRE-family HTH domain